MASEKECAKALDQHEKELSENPQVQGLGIVAEEGKPFDSDELAVAVYVEKKVPDEELATEYRLPATLAVELEGRLHEVPVRVIEQGPVELEAARTESVGEVAPTLEDIGAENLEPSADDRSEE